MLREFLETARAADYRRWVLGSASFAAEEATAPGIRVAVGDAGAVEGIGRVVPLDWDSDFLGTRAGRIEGLFLRDRTPPEPLVRRLVETADEAGIAFINCRVDAEELGLVQALEDEGFRLVDILAIHALELSDATPARHAAPLAEFVERCATGMDRGRMFSDRRVGAERAREFYRAVTDYHLRRGAHATVIERHGEPAGLAIGVVDPAMSEHLGRRYGYLWLLAVAPEHRGHGIGTALFARFREEFAARCELLEIGTQIGNPANAIYRHAGCRLVAHTCTLHRWKTGRAN